MSADSGTPAITGTWTKPSRSNNLSNLSCAEVASTADGGVAIRSDQRLSTTVYLDATETAKLFAGIKAGTAVLTAACGSM